jgi:hypothetical protein
MVFSVLHGCAVVPVGYRPAVTQTTFEEAVPGNEQPYLVGEELDMVTPVYIAAYPDFLFYHRYDVGCNCIYIVRSVEVGGVVHWIDHTGKRVHEGHWAQSRPSAQALRGYRDWSKQHRGEIHRELPRVRPAGPSMIKQQQQVPSQHQVQPQGQPQPKVKQPQINPQPQAKPQPRVKQPQTNQPQIKTQPQIKQPQIKTQPQVKQPQIKTQPQVKQPPPKPQPKPPVNAPKKKCPDNKPNC